MKPSRDIMALTDRTLQACAELNLPEVSELRRAVIAARAAKVKRDEAAKALPAAETAEKAAKQAWGDDQTDARWKAVERARTAADAALVRLDALDATVGRAEREVEPALGLVLAAERKHIADEFEATIGPALTEYVAAAAALEGAAAAIASAHARTRAQCNDLFERLRAVGLVDQLTTLMPSDCRLKLSPMELTGTLLADYFGQRRFDCIHAETPLDHLTSHPGRGSKMERRAIDAALRTLEASEASANAVVQQPPEAA